MQLKPRHTVIGAVVGVAAFGALAQTTAPGLWEHTVKLKSGDGKVEAAMAQMKKQMEAMPPERRQQMEAAMAKGGMMYGDGGTTVKVCITKEEAAKPIESRMDQSGNCKRSDLQRSGNTIKFKYACATPPSTGEGETTFASDKAYSGHATMNGTAKDGSARQMTMEMSGRWLASDCGDVKPRSSVAK